MKVRVVSFLSVRTRMATQLQHCLLLVAAHHTQKTMQRCNVSRVCCKSCAVTVCLDHSIAHITRTAQCTAPVSSALSCAALFSRRAFLFFFIRFFSLPLYSSTALTHTQVNTTRCRRWQTHHAGYSHFELFHSERGECVYPKII